jgi:hypothetical protein
MVVLAEALKTASSRGEEAAARAGLRALRAKVSFHVAMDLLAKGRPWAARRAALRGFPTGGVRTAGGLLALAVAPSLAARAERATRRYRYPAGAAISAARPPGDTP